MPAAIDGLLSGRRVPLTAGAKVRDYLHVRDVARALVAIGHSDCEGAVNVASGSPVTVAHVARTLGELAGRTELLDFGALPYSAADPPFICADVAKLKSLGWEPGFDLMSGLRHTMEWWRSRQPASCGP